MIVQLMSGYVKWHSLHTRGSGNIADISYKMVAWICLQLWRFLTFKSRFKGRGMVYRRNGLNLTSQLILIMVTELVIETLVISDQLTQRMAGENVIILATVKASDLTSVIIYLNILSVSLACYSLFSKYCHYIKLFYKLKCILPEVCVALWMT